MIWQLALRQAMTEARVKFRKEHGERLPITGELMLTDDEEQFFTACSAKTEDTAGRQGHREIMVLKNQLQLNAIYDEDHLAGIFLDRN